MRLTGVLIGLALLACGGAPGPSNARPHRARASRAHADSADAAASSTRATVELHQAWSRPADGPALVTAALELDGHRTIRLSGAWPVRITDDRATVEIGGERIEGDLAPGWRRISCTRVPLQFSVGGIEVQIPVGGHVELVGREGDRARVAAPVAALNGTTRLVDGATVADDACSSPADTGTTGDAAGNNGRLCLTGRPEQRPDATLVPLSSSAPVRLLERDGEWVRVRTRVFEDEVTGWLRAADLDADAPSGPPSTLVELTAPLRVGSREVPAGTRAWQVESQCENCEGPRTWLEVALREGQRRAVLRFPASNATVRRLADQEASGDRRVVSTMCFATGTDPASLGSLSRESIRSVIRANVSEVRACYESRLDHRPILEGRLLTSFIIGGNGRLQSIVTHGDMEDAFVRRCVERAMRMWRFPPPEGGGVVGVNYPFALTSRP